MTRRTIHARELSAGDLLVASGRRVTDVAEPDVVGLQRITVYNPLSDTHRVIVLHKDTVLRVERA